MVQLDLVERVLMSSHFYPEFSPLHHTASQILIPGHQPTFLCFLMWETNSGCQNQVIPQKRIITVEENLFYKPQIYEESPMD